VGRQLEEAVCLYQAVRYIATDVPIMTLVYHSRDTHARQKDMQSFEDSGKDQADPCPIRKLCFCACTYTFLVLNLNPLKTTTTMKLLLKVLTYNGV
jgi:hypothetical protein